MDSRPHSGHRLRDTPPDDAPVADSSRWWLPWVALAIFVTFAVLFAIRSTMWDLQGDELWTRLVVRLPLADSLPFVLRDGKHPPFYSLVQWILGALLPDTPLALRALSIIAAASIPAAVFLFATTLGARLLPALALASWIGMHPTLQLHAINARSYALFAALVSLHAMLLLRYLRANSPHAPTVAGILAAAAIMTHAFGILFIGATVLGAAAVIVLRPGTNTRSLRALFLAHLPALAIFAVWYAVVLYSLRNTAGLSAGLNWVEMPTVADRAYTLVVLLGSADVPAGTRLTLLMWSVIAITALLQLRQRRTAQLVTGIAVTAIFAPFVAQNLASGIIADSPLWGERHVLPTVGLLAVLLAASLRPGRMPMSWGRIVGVALLASAILSLRGVTTWRRTYLSDVVATYRTMRPAAELVVTYPYGELSVANYYWDRACLDDYQMRVQFPDVRGAADESTRSDRCVAHVVPRDSAREILLVYRPFAEREVAVRDSLLVMGWHVRHDYPARPTDRLHAILLERVE